LQKRFLSIGCLSSAPPIVLALLSLGAAVARAHVARASHLAATGACDRPPIADRAHSIGSRARAARVDAVAIASANP
jgi:hypothetical protein